MGNLLSSASSQESSPEIQYITACKNGNLNEVVRILTINNIEFKVINEGFFHSIKNGHLKIIQYLTSRVDFSEFKCDMTPLACACQHGQKEIIDYFLMNFSLDIHEFNDQALMVSLTSFRPHIAEYTINAEGKPDHVYNDDILQTIIDHGFMDIAKALIKKNKIYIARFKEIVPKVNKRFMNNRIIDYINSI